MSDSTPLDAAWRTDNGLVRGHNEDFVIVYEPPTEDDRRRHGALYIVADGVGGADAGEVASQYASERTLHHYLAAAGRTDWGARLIDAMQAANTDLRRMAADRDDSRRMATTMVAAVIQDGHAYICLLYTSDAADERSSVDLGGRRIIKKKQQITKKKKKREKQRTKKKKNIA